MTPPVIIPTLANEDTGTVGCRKKKWENWIITVSALGITHSRPDKILFPRVHDIKKWKILFVCTLFCCLHSVFKCFSMYSIFAYQVFRFISRIEHLASEDVRMSAQVSDVINFSYVCLFVCFWGLWSTREFFTHMETSTLPVLRLRGQRSNPLHHRRVNFLMYSDKMVYSPHIHRNAGYPLPPFYRMGRIYI